MPNSPVSILVVTESSNDFDRIREMLQQSPERAYEPGQAVSLAEAIEKIRGNRPQAVILDLNLTDSQGLETIRSMLSQEPLLDVIALVSGQELGIHALQENARDYLLKRRMNSDQLARSLRYVLERRRLMDELDSRRQASNHALDDARHSGDLEALTSVIAHELRNPLAAIKLSAYNLHMKTADPMLARHIATIEKKVMESNQIINNLLYYARLKPAVLKNFSLQPLLQSCLDAAEQRHPHPVVAVECRWDAQNPLCLDADAIQLKELFDQVLNNAYDALDGRESPRIMVSAERENDWLKVIIRDNGIGIAEADLDKVARPFYTTKAKATGMGLAVSSQIARLHGGDIAVQSRKGEGSMVTITLPLRHPPEPPA